MDYYSLRLYRFYKKYSSLLLPHLFQPCSGSPFPLPRPNSYHSPIIHHLTPLHSLFAPASPPQLAQARSDHPPGRRPHRRHPPLVCASLPCCSTTRSSSRNPVTAVPNPVAPPISVLNLRPGTCHSQGLSRLIIPPSLCLPPSPIRLPSPCMNQP